MHWASSVDMRTEITAEVASALCGLSFRDFRSPGSQSVSQSVRQSVREAVGCTNAPSMAPSSECVHAGLVLLLSAESRPPTGSSVEQGRRLIFIPRIRVVCKEHTRGSGPGSRLQVAGSSRRFPEASDAFS